MHYPENPERNFMVCIPEIPEGNFINIYNN
jgi:hypothetical protein